MLRRLGHHLLRRPAASRRRSAKPALEKDCGRAPVRCGDRVHGDRVAECGGQRGDTLGPRRREAAGQEDDALQVRRGNRFAEHVGQQRLAPQLGRQEHVGRRVDAERPHVAEHKIEGVADRGKLPAHALAEILRVFMSALVDLDATDLTGIRVDAHVRSDATETRAHVVEYALLVHLTF
eukprot:3058766-Prymnesium_polylepis.1